MPKPPVPHRGSTSKTTKTKEKTKILNLALEEAEAGRRKKKRLWWSDESYSSLLTVYGFSR
jgi:hypothetical protein